MRSFSPTLKVDRAKHHIRDLKVKIGKFLGKNPYSLVFEAHPKPNMVYIVCHASEQFPKGIPLIVGDVFHNLRGALDHLMCCVAGTTKHVQFPICSSRAVFEETLKKRNIGCASKRAISVIDSLQPYAREEGLDLVAINRLNNRDKHRLLIVVAAVSKLKETDIKWPDGRREWHKEWPLTFQPLENRSVLRAVPRSPNSEIGQQVNPKHVSFDVLFGPGPCRDEPLGEALERLAGRVEETITTLKPFV